MVLEYLAGALALACSAGATFVYVSSFLERKSGRSGTFLSEEHKSKTIKSRIADLKNTQGSLVYNLVVLFLRALAKSPTISAWSNLCTQIKLPFLKDYALCLNTDETVRVFCAQVILAVVTTLVMWRAIGPASIICGLMLVLAPLLVLASERKRVRHATREALIVFVEQLIDALKANKSLLQALSMSASTVSQPFSACIQRTISLSACGVSTQRAFSQAVHEMNLTDAIALTAALEVHAKTGGNLIVLLQDFASQYRQALLFEQNLKTQTAQGRLSVKVVAIIPPLLVVGLNIMSPGYFQAFLASPVGKSLFYGAIALNVTGLLLIQNIMHIKGVD